MMVRRHHTVVQGVRLLHHFNIKHLPVVDEQDRLVGIVSRGDLLRVFLRPDDEIDREISEQILGRPYVAAMSRSRSGSTAGSSASRGTHAPSTTWTCWSSW
jgi:CBS domain-containing protein